MELEPRAQNASGQPGLNAELSDWLENQAASTSSDNQDESSIQELGFTSALYQANLSLYGEIYKQCRLGSRCPQESRERISENLGRFVVLSEVLQHRKIDLCLGKAPEISDGTVRMLYHVGRTLTKGAAGLKSIFARGWSSSPLQQYLEEVAIQNEKARFLLSPPDDSDDLVEDLTAVDDESFKTSADVQFNNEINRYITALADLVPTLQDLLREETHAPGKQHGHTGVTTFHVTDSAKQYVMQIQDKLPQASTTLVERLGEANWQRHLRIRRKMHQREGLYEDPDGEEKLSGFQSTFVPTEFHDSGLGNSVTFGPHFTRSVASHTSILSSYSDGEKRRLRAPATPGEVLDGVPFTCWICGNELTSIKNRAEWEAHVFHDLQPYICTFDGCCDALTTFPTRKLWAEHEFREHRVRRFLKCYCSRAFTNKETFVRHLKYEHFLALHRSQLLTQLAAAETAEEQPLQGQQCPLCLQGRPPGQDRWASHRQFIKHVGRHLEEIALASLPRDFESDTEATSQRSGSSTPLHTSIRNHVRSVSVRSVPLNETSTRGRLRDSTAANDARSTSPSIETQRRTVTDDRLPRPRSSFHNTTALPAYFDPRPQLSWQAPIGHPAQDPGRWADGPVGKKDTPAINSLQEALPASVALTPTEIHSAFNSTSENTWLEQNTAAPGLQHHVPQEPGGMEPQPTLPYTHMQQPATEQFYPHQMGGGQYGTPGEYYAPNEVPFHLNTSPSAPQGRVEFENPSFFGEYAYDAARPDQYHTENFASSAYQSYGLPGARHQLLPQAVNSIDVAVQPVPYQGSSLPPVNASPQTYVGLNLKRRNGPRAPDLPPLVPKSQRQRKRRKVERGESSVIDQGSTLPEPANARSPVYSTVVPESERAVECRRLVDEQWPFNRLDNDILRPGIARQTEAVRSHRTAAMSDDTESAFEARGAFEDPQQSDAVAVGASWTPSLQPSSPPGEAPRGRLSHLRAGQGGTQANDHDLDAYRQLISSMYLTERKTLAKVMEFMKETHNVVASKKQFKTYLKRAHIKKNFDCEDVAVMLSLRRDVEDRGQTCKIYWCNKEITPAKIQLYLRKKKATEAELLARVNIPSPVPSYIVVEVLSQDAKAPEALPSRSPDQPESSFVAPIFTGSTAPARPPAASGCLRRRACVACRRIKVKCDFSDGEGASAPSCIRCRQEHKDCVVRQARRKRTPPATRRAGKRKRARSTTPAASLTSGTSTSIDPYHVADGEDTTFANLTAGVNFGSDDSL